MPLSPADLKRTIKQIEDAEAEVRGDRPEIIGDVAEAKVDQIGEKAFQLYEYYEAEGDLALSRYWLKKAAERNFANSRLALANLLLASEEHRANYELAAASLYASVVPDDQGHADADINRLLTMVRKLPQALRERALKGIVTTGSVKDFEERLQIFKEWHNYTNTSADEYTGSEGEEKFTHVQENVLPKVMQWAREGHVVYAQQLADYYSGSDATIVARLEFLKIAAGLGSSRAIVDLFLHYATQSQSGHPEEVNSRFKAKSLLKILETIAPETYKKQMAHSTFADHKRRISVVLTGPSFNEAEFWHHHFEEAVNPRAALTISFQSAPVRAARKLSLPPAPATAVKAAAPPEDEGYDADSFWETDEYKATEKAIKTVAATVTATPVTTASASRPIAQVGAAAPAFIPLLPGSSSMIGGSTPASPHATPKRPLRAASLDEGRRITPPDEKAVQMSTVEVVEVSEDPEGFEADDDQLRELAAFGLDTTPQKPLQKPLKPISKEGSRVRFAVQSSEQAGGSDSSTPNSEEADNSDQDPLHFEAFRRSQNRAAGNSSDEMEDGRTSSDERPYSQTAAPVEEDGLGSGSSGPTSAQTTPPMSSKAFSSFPPIAIPQGLGIVPAPPTEPYPLRVLPPLVPSNSAIVSAVRPQFRVSASALIPMPPVSASPSSASSSSIAASTQSAASALILLPSAAPGQTSSITALLTSTGAGAGRAPIPGSKTVPNRAAPAVPQTRSDPLLPTVGSVSALTTQASVSSDQLKPPPSPALSAIPAPPRSRD